MSTVERILVNVLRYVRLPSDPVLVILLSLNKIKNLFPLLFTVEPKSDCQTSCPIKCAGQNFQCLTSTTPRKLLNDLFMYLRSLIFAWFIFSATCVCWKYGSLTAGSVSVYEVSTGLVSAVEPDGLPRQPKKYQKSGLVSWSPRVGFPLKRKSRKRDQRQRSRVLSSRGISE